MKNQAVSSEACRRLGSIPAGEVGSHPTLVIPWGVLPGGTVVAADSGVLKGRARGVFLWRNPFEVSE